MNIIDEDIQFDEIMQRKQYQLICIILDRNINYYHQFVSKNGQPLLHTLIMDKQIEITHYVIHIIEKQCQNPKDIIDQQNEVQQTPLMFACYYGFTSIIRQLLKLEANINAKDKNLFSPILFAMKNNKTFITIYLIFKGADLFSKDLNGCGLAHFAAFNDNVFILKFLKNLFKFNIFEQDNLKKTPLKRSEDQCAYNCSRYLISQQRNTDYKSTHKLINHLIKKQKKTFSFKKIQSCQQHIRFLLIIVYNTYLINIFFDHQDKLIRDVSLFLQIFIIFLNFIFFYIIESAPKAGDSYIQSEQSHISLSFSQDQTREIHGCLEIDQTGVPLIQDENNYNQSLSLICGNILDIDKPFIRHIINQIDNGKQINLELNQICLDCMIVKHPKAQHCKYCNFCHVNFQLHSNFYMKCFSDDWIFIFYFLLLVAQLISSAIYLDFYFQRINYDLEQIEFDFHMLTVIFITVLIVHQLVYALLLLYSIISQNTYYEIMNKEKCWYRYKNIVQKNGLLVRIIT